jgi:hypothetical protein
LEFIRFTFFASCPPRRTGCKDAKALKIFLCGSASWHENKEKNPAKQESRQGYWILLCVMSAALNVQKN